MRMRVLIVTLLVLGCCGPAHAASVVDDAGTRVELAAPARRIVSLAPNVTELVFAAGAGERIVGTVFGADFPPAARTLRRIGDAYGLDLEAILKLKPDLVATWPYTASEQVDLLRARGLPVFMVDPREIDGIATVLERLGELADTRAVAAQSARTFRERLAALRAKYAGRAPVRVFYEVWNSPLVTLGGQHLVTRAIETCGGRNVFASLSQPAPTVSVEAVLAAQPQAIIGGVDDGRPVTWLEEWSRWRTIPAVANRQLSLVNADLLHRPGPRFVEGLAELCAAIDRAR
jgi:iron complex transport system substrate-binding protein